MAMTKRPAKTGVKKGRKTKAAKAKGVEVKAAKTKVAKTKVKQLKKVEAKRPKSRLTPPAEGKLTKAQKTLRDAIASGPRKRFVMGGPFAIYMEAPEYGLLAQELGGHVRLKTSVAPRLSEFAILCVARLWRAQYEWVAHEPIALAQGVKPETIKSLKSGRYPKTAKKDEAMIYDFVKELHDDRRVSDATYKKVNKLLGNAGTVELVGILGYYTMVAMQLNVFNAEIPADKPMPFKE